MATNIRGLDVSGVSAMKSAIQTYTTALNKKINGIAAIDQTVLDKAIKGKAAQTEFKNMVSRARKEAKTFTAKLAQFESAIDKLKANYESSTQASGSTSFSSIAK